MAKHALFGASSAERWANCAGALTLCKDAPKTSNAAANEGTAGHTLGERCLTDNTEPTDFVGEVIRVDISDTQYDDIEVSDDLADAVQSYVDHVRGITGIRWLEVRTYYNELIGVDEEDGFGTGDCVIVDSTIVNVLDAKFGRNYVDPFKNKQMILYAGAVVSTLETIGEQVTEIRLHIVQPRVSEKPIPYVLTRNELFAEIANLRKAAQRAVEAAEMYDGSDYWYQTYVTPGDMQCKYCPVAPVCRSLQKAVVLDVDNDFDLENILTAQPLEELEAAYSRIELMDIWTKAVEHQLMRRFSAGEKGNAYKLVTGREGNRRYAKPDQVIEVFSDDPGIYQPAKLKSPAQMEKQFKKKDPRLAKLEIIRNPAKPTLAEQFDPRPAWAPSAGVDEFEVIDIA